MTWREVKDILDDRLGKMGLDDQIEVNFIDLEALTTEEAIRVCNDDDRMCVWSNY